MCDLCFSPTLGTSGVCSGHLSALQASQICLLILNRNAWHSYRKPKQSEFQKRARRYFGIKGSKPIRPKNLVSGVMARTVDITAKSKFQ